MRDTMMLLIVLSLVLPTMAVCAETGGDKPVVEPIPTTCQLVTQRLVDAITGHIVDYFVWPTTNAVQHPKATVSLAAARDAETWINRVLQPRWTIADYSPYQLLCRNDVRGYANSSTSQLVGYDSVRCRYRIGGTAIQVTQTSFAMGLVIQPDSGLRLSMGQNLTCCDFADRLLPRFLNEAARIVAVTTVRIENPGIAEAKPNDALQETDTNVWHDTVSWWTDGVSVAFLIPKSCGGPYAPAALRHWLDER